MLTSYGLYGHIRSNTTKSVLLLASFTGLIALTWFAWCLIYAAGYEHFARTGASFGDLVGIGTGYAIKRWWLPIFFSACWFVVAYMVYGDLIRLATRARPVSRKEQPKLYNLVENLAISAGLPMPRIDIIYTPARNAFASGLDPASACITVTTGLLRTLNEQELQAVLAHEMTHIKNGDVRFMVIATVFAGGLTLAGDAVAKMFKSNNPSVSDLYYMYGSDHPEGERLSNGNGRGLGLDTIITSEGGDPVAVIATLVVGIMFLATAHISALLVRFAISRAREFLADAGSVELTKDPDALISALQKIAGADDIPGLDPNLRALMISGAAETLFSTHPPIEARIFALQQYAGGRITSSPRRPLTARTTAAEADIAQPAAALGFAGGRPAFGKRSRAMGA